MLFPTWKELYASTADSLSQTVDQQFVAFKDAFNAAQTPHAKLDLVSKSNAVGILCACSTTDPTTQTISNSIILLHHLFRLPADWTATKPDDHFFGVCGLDTPNPGAAASLLRVPDAVFESAGNDIRVPNLATFLKHANALELLQPAAEDGVNFVFEPFKPIRGTVIPPSLILPIATNMANDLGQVIRASIEASADLMATVDQTLAGDTMQHCLETIQFIWILSTFKNLNLDLVIDGAAFGISQAESVAVKQKFDLEVTQKFLCPPPPPPPPPVVAAIGGGTAPVDPMAAVTN
jgi:hypothetical protein